MILTKRNSRKVSDRLTVVLNIGPILLISQPAKQVTFILTHPLDCLNKDSIGELFTIPWVPDLP